MGYVVINVDGEDLVFKIKNINSIGFYDRLSRARFDSSLFLSLIVQEPCLSADEWYKRVPVVWKEDIINAIVKYVNENYNYSL